MKKKLTQYIVELITVLLILLSFGLKSPNIGVLFNSDALYLPILLSDLINGGNISDWYLTPSPYLFPDLIFFYLMHIAGVEGYWSVISYSLLQVFIFSFLLHHFFKILYLHEPKKLHDLALLIMISAAVILGGSFQYILISAHHFSVVTVSILTLILILSSSHSKFSGITIAIIFAFLMGLCDSLFVIQFSVPLALAVVIVYCIRRTNRIFLVGNILLLSSIFGYLTYSLLITNPTRYSADIGFIKFSRLVFDFSELSKVDRVNILSLCFITLTVLVGLVKINKLKSWLRGLEFNQCVAIVFAFCSTVVNSFVVAVTTNLEAADRYFIPFAVFTSIGLAFYLNRFNWLKISSLIVTLILLFSINFGLLYQKNGLAFDYEEDKIKCLNSAINSFSLNSGIAEYWDAKKYQFLTGDKVKLAQFNYEGNPYYWITSSSFFDENFTFFLISENSIAPNMINYENLIKANGEPISSRNCGRTHIYIYDKPIKLDS